MARPLPFFHNALYSGCWLAFISRKVADLAGRGLLPRFGSFQP